MSDLFDDYQAFNKYQVFDGMRVNTSGTKPSVYITEIKLKKVLRELSDFQLEELLEQELTPYSQKIQRERLTQKIDRLQEWQLWMALSILTNEGRIESISYVSKCKRTDKPQN